MDYMYTAFHQASIDGTPVLHPLWNKYPKDPNTFGIDLQFFYGDSILVSPVTEENATSVVAYFPNDIFYDFNTLEPLQGKGSNVTLENLNLTQIPVHIKGGTVLPLRVESAMTTDELRKKSFELVVAPNANGEASGQLYFDDGESIKPDLSTFVQFSFKQQKLTVTGKIDIPLNFSCVKILGAKKKPSKVDVPTDISVDGHFDYDEPKEVLEITIGAPFTKEFELSFQ